MQHCFLLIIDKWEKKRTDDNKLFRVFIKNLSKAFECICHDLLIVKLSGYGLSVPALKLMQDYLQNPKQSTKTGSSYSSWEYIITSGVSQDSILTPLPFKIFLWDLFFWRWK